MSNPTVQGNLPQKRKSDRYRHQKMATVFHGSRVGNQAVSHFDL